MEPIIKKGVRVLTPQEYKILYDVIPKKDYKLMFSALLHTGMRYEEFRRFQKNPQWFNGSNIRLPEEEGEKKVTKIQKKVSKYEQLLKTLSKQEIQNAFDVDGIKKLKTTYVETSRKPKKHLGRTIILNPVGKTIVSHFLNYCETPLPIGQTWKDNLRRWSVKGELNPAHIGVKTTRKTLACWLFTLYPDKQIIITTSLGHNIKTALEHYLDIGFKDYIEEIKEHLSG